MKHVGNAYGQVTSLLRDYLRPLGMLCEAGPLRVMRELTSGILFTGSVQLTNAARLFCSTANQLSGAIERMSHHLMDESWDHRQWAGLILHQQAGFVEEDDLIPIGSGLGKYRWPVERSLSWMHQSRRLRVRDERRDDIHEALMELREAMICWSRLHHDFC